MCSSEGGYGELQLNWSRVYWNMEIQLAKWCLKVSHFGIWKELKRVLGDFSGVCFGVLIGRSADMLVLDSIFRHEISLS